MSGDRTISSGLPSFLSPDIGSQKPSAESVAGVDPAQEVALSQSPRDVVQVVDPDRCRVWAGNRRLYDLLDEVSCATLVDSIREHGHNIVPALVRPVKGEPGIDFEVCAGSRRLWCVRYLVGRGFTGISYRVIVEPGWSDVAIFRAYEAENRARTDLSPYERGQSYEYALREVFRGDLRALLETTTESERRVRRLLQLAQLPAVFVQAFGDPRVVVVNHAVRLARLREHAGSKVEREAARLAREQQGRREAGQPLLPPRAVMRALDRAADSGASDHVVLAPVLDARGRTLVSGRFEPSSGWVLTIARPDAHSTLDQYLDAVKRAIGDRFA